MAKRRDWEALSESYRRRLERGGITRSAYESGASLSAARGHAKTPEKPERVAKNPGKYADYTKRKAAPKTRSDSDRLARKTKAIGKRYDIPDILTFVKPSERADFVSGWEIANSEYRVNGNKVSANNMFGRSRLDILEQENPEAPKAIGYYH